MKSEIYEIPSWADMCYQKNKGIILPENVPYLGMGASYFAAKTFKYLGIKLMSEMSSEYFNYLGNFRETNNGVLISQSGQSSETLWCADYFKSFVAIINESDSPLGNHKNCTKKLFLYSGNEELIPTKTYINTLLILYLGFGFDPLKALQVLKDDMSFFERLGEELGEAIFKHSKKKRKTGIYILGSGPNITTANLAALILSEVTKIPFTPMSVSQYDHGHKETAENSFVIAINHDGPEFLRTRNLLKRIEEAGARIFMLSQPIVESLFSPLIFPIPFFFAASYLAEKLKIGNPFTVGNKVTLVNKNL